MKKPRLFYLEEGVNAWIPVPFENEEIPCILEVGDFFEDGEVREIQFKRVDLTDEEFDNLPETC